MKVFVSFDGSLMLRLETTKFKRCTELKKVKLGWGLFRAETINHNGFYLMIFDNHENRPSPERL